jgi:hypothetical protein
VISCERWQVAVRLPSQLRQPRDVDGKLKCVVSTILVATVRPHFRRRVTPHREFSIVSGCKRRIEGGSGMRPSPESPFCERNIGPRIVLPPRRQSCAISFEKSAEPSQRTCNQVLSSIAESPYRRLAFTIAAYWLALARQQKVVDELLANCSEAKAPT